MSLHFKCLKRGLYKFWCFCQRSIPSAWCTHQGLHPRLCLCSWLLWGFDLPTSRAGRLLRCIWNVCSKALLIFQEDYRLFLKNSWLFQPFYPFFKLFSSAFASLHWLLASFLAFLHCLPHQKNCFPYNLSWFLNHHHLNYYWTSSYFAFIPVYQIIVFAQSI